ncbi:hypothetical protein QZH41_014422, partial [Actinostola sp. cb2023]
MTELSSQKDKYIKWLAEEMELNHKHEELLAKREMVLATTSSVYKTKEIRQKSRKMNLLRATTRNDQLIQEVEKAHQSLGNKVNSSAAVSFIALRVRIVIC